MNTVKFPLGQIVATPMALEAFKKNGTTPLTYLARHNTGDWGDVPEQDKEANEAALDPRFPKRIVSSYRLPDETKFWIITEWDRSVTTVLLPEDYVNERYHRSESD